MTPTVQFVGAYGVALFSSTQPAVHQAEPPPQSEVWAGHQVTLGTRDVPFKGTLRTRVDTFVLARVRRHGDVIEIEEKACRVQFAPVAGVSVKMDAAALPRTRMRLRREDSGEFQGRSDVGWSKEDIDRDGKPGMTIGVDARVCSGNIYVANRSRTRATASFEQNALRGNAKVRVEQRVLGAEGFCLSVAAKDSDERVRGPFAYVPVDDDATCESLLRGSWPVDAL